jgi:diguanylate cyclase (GGDEF)-like protein
MASEFTFITVVYTVCVTVFLYFFHNGYIDVQRMRPVQQVALIHYAETLASNVALFRVSGGHVPPHAPGSIQSIADQVASFREEQRHLPDFPKDIDRDFTVIETLTRELIADPTDTRRIERLMSETRLFAGTIDQYTNSQVADQTRELRDYANISGLLSLMVALAGFGVLGLLHLLVQKNASLRVLAEVDGLTGLPNRRIANARAEALCQAARRSGRWVSLAIIDLDHFKRINDEYGHPAGDAVLQQVGRLLESCRRREDIAARLGGEEFALIMPDTDPADAASLCERVRNILDQATFRHGEGDIRVTASIGVASGRGDGAAFDHLYRRADEALYGAKTEGRNRVVADAAPAPMAPS